MKRGIKSFPLCQRCIKHRDNRLKKIQEKLKEMGAGKDKSIYSFSFPQFADCHVSSFFHLCTPFFEANCHKEENPFCAACFPYNNESQSEYAYNYSAKYFTVSLPLLSFVNSFAENYYGVNVLSMSFGSSLPNSTSATEAGNTSPKDAE